MTHIHISSDDVATGQTFDGTFDMSIAVSGTMTLQSHYIEAGLIPWMYTGGNQLLITRTSDSSSHTINFGQVDQDDAITVQDAIIAAFDAVIFLAGTLCVFNAVTNAYDVTLSEGVTLIWSNDASTAKNVFSKKNASNELVAGAFEFSLSGRDVDSRPKYLAVYIKESGTSNSGSRADPGDFIVSTFDEEVRQSQVQLKDIHTVLSVEWRRINVPNLPVPMLLKWDLVFK